MRPASNMHLTMSRFLSNDRTKADLTDYLATKNLEFNQDSPKVIVTSASGHTRSNRDMYFDKSNHEEADTLMISHAVAAIQRNGKDAHLTFFSPDTDVLVLAIANYDALPHNTSISMKSGEL